MFKRFFCISSDLSIVFERHLINAVIRQNRRGNVRNVPSFSYSSALLNRTLLPVFNQSAWGVKHSYTHSHLKKRMDAPIQTAALLRLSMHNNKKHRPKYLRACAFLTVLFTGR